MNTIGKQIEGLIQDSVSRTMNIKLPLQDNDQERNMLIEIMKEQERQKQQIRALRIAVEQLRSDISVIVHHHEYNC